MSGSTLQIESFDNFFSKNYKKLYVHALCLEKTEDRAIDLLHDVYLKVKQRIILSGYTSIQYITYICTSITNTYYANRKAKKNRLNYIQVEDCYLDIEKDNLDKAVDWLEDEQYHQQTENMTKMIFKFLDGRYDEREIFVFNCYFMMHQERMTYEKISKQTGMSIAYCSKAVKKIKTDIKNNLHSFIIANDTTRVRRITSIV